MRDKATKITDFNEVISDFKNLNYDDLMLLIEDLDIELFNSSSLNGLGLAIENKIYVNFDKLNSYQPILTFFVICHELTHVLSIRKQSVSKVIKELSNENFMEFSNHILHEEMLADKFATILFFKLNESFYPKELTQKLNDVNYYETYRSRLKKYHMLNDGTIETYNKNIDLNFS